MSKVGLLFQLASSPGAHYLQSGVQRNLHAGGERLGRDAGGCLKPGQLCGVNRTQVKFYCSSDGVEVHP